MKWSHTRRSLRDYDSAALSVQAAFDKQIQLLLKDRHHPSLRTKKYQGAGNVWQARVNRDWRFYFLIEPNLYTILAIIPHPK